MPLCITVNKQSDTDYILSGIGTKKNLQNIYIYVWGFLLIRTNPIKQPTASFQDLLAFIREEVEATELVAMLKRGEPQGGKTGATGTESNKLNPSEHDTTAMAGIKTSGKQAPGVKKARRKPPYPCIFFKETHSASQFTVEAEKKVQQVCNENRCINCLKEAHRAQGCSKPPGCGNCGAKHHTTLRTGN